VGDPIGTDQAWRKFGDWKSHRREIGVIFFSTSGTMLYTMGFIELIRNGGLRLKSSTMKAAFNLRGAHFSYGSLQTWPRWPAPPIVEVIAIQVQLSNGDWLALAEGLRPGSLLPPALPE
jgi:hypothetical protein